MIKNCELTDDHDGGPYISGIQHINGLDMLQRRVATVT